MSRSERGAAAMPLLLLLIVLLGGGAYNYHRNFTAEQQVPRPYKGYSLQDLEALRAAYQGEAEKAENRYQAAKDSRGARRGAGLLDDNIRAFEAVQKQAGRTRDLGGRLAMQQATVEKIENELSRRAEESDPVKLHLKRLLTI